MIFFFSIILSGSESKILVKRENTVNHIIHFYILVVMVHLKLIAHELPSHLNINK